MSTGKQAPSIFINYRRTDTQAYAILLKEKIEAAFEHVKVRVDTEDVEIGDPWPEKLTTWLEDATIMISLVGQNWLSSKDEFERRRIDNPEDWVRKEIEFALLKEKTILTVLVDKGQMPPKGAFSQDDKLGNWAANRQFYEIRPNHVSSDFKKLRDRIANLCEIKPLSSSEAAKRENILRDYPLSAAVRKKDPRIRMKGNKEVKDLCPFVGLEYFSRQTARLFFGREKEVLELILEVLNKNTRLILLHGYSGVGKSSLLSAGLVPRLEEKVPIFYHRRNKSIGLANGLHELRKKTKGADQQVVYILDQVEEMFTDRNTVKERKEFAGQLIEVFKAEPNATTILGFRSEYLSKVKEELCDAKMLEKHGAEQEIRPLTTDGIIRAIRGVADEEGLNRIYYLEIAKGLPGRMARDLRNYQYADYVAPILQVRLKKMWEAAGKASGVYRMLSISLYEKLGEISERELLDIQLSKLSSDILSEQEALRVLNEFVIDKPSAGTIRTEDLEGLFKENPLQEDYQQDLEALKKIDLLIENKENTNIRLSHDLLAPIVRQRYNEMMSDENYTLRLENFELHYQHLAEQLYKCEHDRAVEPLYKALATNVRKEKLEKPLLELTFFHALSGQYSKAIEVLKKGKSFQVLDEELLEDLESFTTIITKDRLPEKLFETVKSLNRDYFEELYQDYFPDMLPVKGGQFMMGSNEGSDREKPAHQIKINSFQLAKTQLTFRQFSLFCASTKRPLEKNAPSWGIHADHPVVKVNWYDAVKYCNWLSETHGLEKVYEIDKNKKDPNNKRKNDNVKWLVKPNFKANGYRLPTEAEWEFAARGGNESRGFEFAGSNNLDEVGWHDKNADSQTHPVARKQANELGLYDMSGNVWEWCWDWFGPYSAETQQNPKGPESGSGRVIRGGSWGRAPRDCRAANRGNYDPSARYSLGFRLARSSR